MERFDVRRHSLDAFARFQNRGVVQVEDGRERSFTNSAWITAFRNEPRGQTVSAVLVD